MGEETGEEMSTPNREDELKIIDYWYINEFLTQGNIRHRKAPANRVGEKKKAPKVIEGYLSLASADDIETAVSQLAKTGGMEEWSNITIYLGKISRENCISEIMKSLGHTEEDDDRPEVSHDHIACASLQITSDYEYVEESFSLSPVLWAQKRLRQDKGTSLSDRLSVAAYTDDSADIEKLIPEGKITTQGLWKIMAKISNEYITQIRQDVDEKDFDYTDQVILFFDMYQNADVREKCDEPEYNRLSSPYYLADLKMVREAVADKKIGNSGMGAAIHSYIMEPYYDNKHQSSIKRNEIINITDENKEEYRKFLLSALDIANAPLAKWPSRFRPAMNQQIAVNAVTTENTSAFKDKNYPVFSVNGPPGTGKTTMLKEIIADSVVEKAKLLSEYIKSDEAFDKCSFVHGKDGNTYYDKYNKYYYSLKNQKINDYEILVTSNNNSAVFNITKELPLEKGILSDLKYSEDDPEEVKKGLSEITGLFSADQADDEDVYFSDVASDISGEKSWGLIAASLGKRSHINDFATKALYSVLKLVKNNASLDEYADKYAEARSIFTDQYSRVEKLREEAGKVSGLYRKAAEYGDSIAEQEKVCSVRREKIRSLHEEYEASAKSDKEHSEKIQNEIATLETDIRNDRERMQQYSQNMQALLNLIRQAEAQAQEARSNAARFLRGRKNRENDLRIAEEKEAEARNLKQQYSEKDSGYKVLEKNIRNNTARVAEDKKELSANDRGSDDRRKTLELAENDLRLQEEKLDQMKADYRKVKEDIVSVAEADKDYTAIDDSYLEALTGDDADAETKALIDDPWFTFSYDIEREKLFYDALMMTKYFVLSSKSCRTNLKHLYAYWKREYPSFGSNTESINFHPDDRQAMVADLYSTMFLLVPVVSSTFASVGNFLKDIKEPGAIGTLIIDEAGQAQPQVALGALYRSRRAVIVGDPRQVEPVVTDDLKLLKSVFTGELYAPYKEKGISVQRCADLINSYGSFLDNGNDYSEWVGCPLVVHRRCISPMFDISNAISYDGMMRKQTLPPKPEKVKTFVRNTCWINVAGTENGGKGNNRSKDHYVSEQGEKAAEIIFRAFELAHGDKPSLFVISPFNSVCDGLRKGIKDFYNKAELRNSKTAMGESQEYLPDKKMLSEWSESNIGTVHKFQGKEADQVIFLLGCDCSKRSAGAIRWVNANIVNVAVTRAKYRLYIIGDGKAWGKNQYVAKAKSVIDTYILKQVARNGVPDDEDEVRQIAESLPTLESFPENVTNEMDGTDSISVDSEDFVNEIDSEVVYERPITDEQAQRFGFRNAEDISRLPKQIRKNIEWGIKLFLMLEPVYKAHNDTDASCCAILFCKALELQVDECLKKGLTDVLPDFEIRVHGNESKKLSEINKNDGIMTLGTFDYIIQSNLSQLAGQAGDAYDESWWNTYDQKLVRATQKRNNCCHSGQFKYKTLNRLLADMFSKGYPDPKDAAESDGLFFTSEVGRKLENAGS